MGKPIVYGPRYSVYTRAVLMALIEKRVPFEQVHIEMDDNAHRAPEHLQRHPFGMLPAFEHNGFMIYETVPILSYIDDAFPGTRKGRGLGASAGTVKGTCTSWNGPSCLPPSELAGSSAPTWMLPALPR